MRRKRLGLSFHKALDFIGSILHHFAQKKVRDVFDSDSDMFHPIKALSQGPTDPLVVDHVPGPGLHLCFYRVVEL